MRVGLVCVGRAKAGAARELCVLYLDRAKAAGRKVGLTFELRELGESRARRAADRRSAEGEAIRAAVGAGARLIAFDERGTTPDSLGFASLVGGARDEGAASLALIVGGPDGLDPDLRRAAFQVIAFGPMTWPHQLVRVMAAEQLYRAVTILTGHPYHRT